MAPSVDFAGKVAVVTGGASGIGRAIAEALAGRGARVVIADVEQAALDRAAREIDAMGVVTDVSAADSVQQLADKVVNRFGKIDLFCSNAGVASTGRIASMETSDWQWLLGVNLWGAIHGVKAFLPLLRANADGGHLAFTSSMAAFHVTPETGGYTTTKFALTALAETLAAELDAEHARVGVTILCPGSVRSRLGESQRNRPDVLAGGAMVDRNLQNTPAGRTRRWLETDVVAATLLRAIEHGELYAFTHPEWAPRVDQRHRAIARAFERAEQPLA